MITAENAQQVVAQRQEEARGARVALTAGTTARLIVDPTGFMALSAIVRAAGLTHPFSSCTTTSYSPFTRAMAVRNAAICGSSVGAFSAAVARSSSSITVRRSPQA